MYTSLVDATARIAALESAFARFSAKKTAELQAALDRIAALESAFAKLKESESEPVVTAAPEVDGASTRATLMNRMREIVGPLPIRFDTWESVKPAERIQLQNMWMWSEYTDWESTLCAQTQAEGPPGSFVALGNGRIVGYFNNSDDAIEASCAAIETTIGTIGISVVQLIKASVADANS